MNPRAKVGDNVRAARLAADISQEALAGETGLDRTYISGIERGVRNPTVLVLVKIADVLAIPPSQLLLGVGSVSHKKKGASPRD
jgi:transcriptional regulator with XRE-family HTH domain